jgi:hypothetical protein
VKKGVDFLTIYAELGYYRISADHREFIKENTPYSDISNMISEYLLTWYGIQLSLLHPELKEMFNHGRPFSIHGSFTKRGSKRVKYIRKHIITVDNIEERVRAAEEYAGITRHTDAWYVIGHWRTYKSGKKVFIKGYWKGPNRDQKETPEELREREVVIPSNIN